MLNCMNYHVSENNETYYGYRSLWRLSKRLKLEYKTLCSMLLTERQVYFKEHSLIVTMI